jgi:SAM-dependent methyltransferase
MLRTLFAQTATDAKALLRRSWRKLSLPFHKRIYHSSPKFSCPICTYYGPFKAVRRATGQRLHAECPRCGALERHRLQFLVLRLLGSTILGPDVRVLHFAPEMAIQRVLRAKCGTYTSADLLMRHVDRRVDIRDLPFADGSFDLVYASHVLEHVDDDYKAISEVRRVLSPDGVAILPVPLVVDHTIEYPAPNPSEAGHVRAPGSDYFDRYLPHFQRVDTYSSARFPDTHQLYVYEDRTRWPSAACPRLTASSGERHADVVPVCFVSEGGTDG